MCMPSGRWVGSRGCGRSVDCMSQVKSDVTDPESGEVAKGAKEKERRRRKAKDTKEEDGDSGLSLPASFLPRSRTRRILRLSTPLLLYIPRLGRFHHGYASSIFKQVLSCFCVCVCLCVRVYVCVCVCCGLFHTSAPLCARNSGEIWSCSKQRRSCARQVCLHGATVCVCVCVCVCVSDSF